MAVVEEAPAFLNVPVDQLHFDPSNPRLPRSVDAEDVTAVLKFMLDDAGLIDLMRSIAAQGFFPGEPLLITEHPAKRDAFLVVEGNRRLAATMLLIHPDLAPTSRTAVNAVAALADDVALDVPCLLFPTYGSILKHLGYRHVTGVKEWEPLAKARFLRVRVSEADGDTLTRWKFVARTIGSRADYVGRLLTALALYENWESNDYYEMNGVNEDSVEFSLLSSALSYKHIYQFLGLSSSYDSELSALSEANLRFLLSFIFEKQEDGLTRLGESRNLGRLNRLLELESSRDALIQGSNLADAEEILGDKAERVRAAILRATSSTQYAIENLLDVELVDSDLSDITTLCEIATELSESAANQARGSSDPV